MVKRSVCWIWASGFVAAGNELADKLIERGSKIRIRVFRKAKGALDLCKDQSAIRSTYEKIVHGLLRLTSEPFKRGISGKSPGRAGRFFRQNVGRHPGRHTMLKIKSTSSSRSS